ncbi:hypothetical protein OHAE_2060 [Ochrobactrum soli]|uniref:Uncharacterized protein n=1 Tax=Ochrobactrum soli TaxID=2448455 RepID=A0A2P9HQE4_9HYPH|nr:hypothetical protein OHAE_2060 [[Ochrobactrum] soli]
MLQQKAETSSNAPWSGQKQEAYLIAARFEAFMTLTFSALQRNAFPAKV